MKLHYESGFMQALTRLANLLILNVCFLAGCLPVITIGASLSAAFSVSLDLAAGRQAGILKAFWKSWQSSLKNGILLELLLLPAAWCLWLNWQIAFNLPDPPLAASLCLWTGLVLLVLHTLYAFALEGRYKNTLWRQLINSRKICQRFFLRTLLLLAVLFLLYMLFFRTSALLTYIGFFVGPALAVYTASSIILPVFRKLEQDGRATDGFSITGN